MPSKAYLILLCGMPASGKSWVATQLPNVTYIANDDYIGDDAQMKEVILKTVREGSRPVLNDCPFAERTRRDYFEARGLVVKPYFIVEKAVTCWRRYKQRSHAPMPFAYFQGREVADSERVKLWKCPHGNSQQVLEQIRKL